MFTHIRRYDNFYIIARYCLFGIKVAGPSFEYWWGKNHQCRWYIYSTVEEARQAYENRKRMKKESKGKFVAWL